MAECRVPRLRVGSPTAARMPVTSTSTCASVSMPPARRAKAGIGVWGIPLAMASADHVIARDREIRRVRQAKRGAAATLGAVTAGTVRGVESLEVEHLVRCDVGLEVPGSRRAVTRRGRWPARQYAGGVSRVVTIPLLLARASVPGVWSPARTASGSGCAVFTRSCLETTTPAAMPNPTWRQREPSPVDARIHHRIDDAENAVEQSGPDDRPDHSAEQDRMARHHWQRGAIQHARPAATSPGE